jgi:hypothetical protein
VEAAEQLQAVARYFLCDVNVCQVQLDALYAVLRAVKDDALGEDEASERLSHSPPWVWAAMAPESKRLLTIDVGERTLAMAQGVGHPVAQMLAPDGMPLFLSDDCKVSLPAPLAHCGFWLQPERCQGQGPRPQPRWMPLPELLDPQMIKTVRRRRLVRVSHRCEQSCSFACRRGRSQRGCEQAGWWEATREGRLRGDARAHGLYRGRRQGVRRPLGGHDEPSRPGLFTPGTVCG